MTPTKVFGHSLVGGYSEPPPSHDVQAGSGKKGETVAAPDLNDVPSLTDEDLVEMIASGDHDAFSNLYDRYFKRVYHFVNRRLNNTADVEETVQEVFINVFSSIDSYRREAPFGAWIFGVTRRTIASRFKKKRHPTVPLDDGDSDNIFSDPGASPVAPSAIETIEFKERVRTINRPAPRTESADPRNREDPESQRKRHQVEPVPRTEDPARILSGAGRIAKIGRVGLHGPG